MRCRKAGAYSVSFMPMCSTKSSWRALLANARSGHRLTIGVHGLADELAVTLHTDSTGGLGAAMVISLSCGVWVGFQEKLDDLAAFLLRCPVERKPVKATGLRGALRVGSQVVAALAPSGGRARTLAPVLDGGGENRGSFGDQLEGSWRLWQLRPVAALLLRLLLEVQLLKCCDDNAAVSFVNQSVCE